VQLAASKGVLHACGHAAFGLVLLGNVAFNYTQCVRTPPGTPEDLPHEVRGSSGVCCSRDTCRNRASQVPLLMHPHKGHAEKSAMLVIHIVILLTWPPRPPACMHCVIHPCFTWRPTLQALAAAAEGGRYCHTCGWPKPQLAHHCHICNRCIDTLQ
jgi:hypothetical protein